MADKRVEIEVDLSKKKYWVESDIIKFGQYKGEDYTVADLIKKKPSYLIWLDDNVEWFNLDDDVRLKAEEAVEKELNKRNSNSRRARGQLFDDDDDIPF